MSHAMKHAPSSGAAVWTRGREGLAEPCPLEELACLAPGWKASLTRFAPWREEGDFTQSRHETGRMGPPIVICGACSSSLDVGWALAGEDALPEWGSVLAVSQRKGRGQLRRQWSSPPGNVYAAWAWPGATGLLDALAPLLAGLVVAEFLETRGVAAEIKWPNDILIAGRKAGGVLLEERGGRVLAGIGLNLASAPDAATLRTGAAAPAGILGEYGVTDDPLGLWSALVNFGQSCYRSCVSATFPGDVISRIERRLAWRGREVRVEEAGEAAYRARVLGLAEDGGLRLARPDKGLLSVTVLHSGSVSLP